MLEDPDELAVLEEIQQELILQEQSVLEEYERSLQFDEECLNAMLDGLDASDKVICPVCRKNNLTVRNHLVFCQCGLYITTQVSCALSNVFNGTPEVSCCEEAVLSYRQQLQCKISRNPIFSGHDRREASVTSRKHSNRAQSQMLSQPRVHSYQWNGGRNQSSHELSSEFKCQVPGKELCFDPLLNYMGRNHKSIDPSGLCCWFTTNFLGNGFTFDHQ